MTNNKYTVGGLFSGIGGIEKAFEQAKYEVKWAIENDKNCNLVYKLNFPNHHLIDKDVMDYKDYISSLDKVDVLTAGFPCQAFSIAGYRKGFKDERGNLFFSITTFIKYLKPRAILLENVKNLENHDDGNTFRIIKKELTDLGYIVHYKVMNTCDYTDIPQNRERIFIIAFLYKKHSEAFKFPNKFDQRKLKPIHKFFVPDEQVDNKFDYNDFYDIKKLRKIMDDINTLYQYRRTDPRKNMSNMCPALTANMGTGGHNVPLRLVKINTDGTKIIRKLTPKECFSFQGLKSLKLPSNISDTQLYKQAGNSVTVPLVKKLAVSIKKALDID